ncbi:hypothetical protein J5J83_08160 [Azoarcus sp. L1K30]|uniref:hypothetical protein n=1 Tax=Azoarcus sp. L1K30 TaxID=2820277 RepID=UPI001B825A94|nr:hypothetical protein [Azoarcus sp. L1K30]MBR0566087.1 hypothetical protein [Azoarcus sp. L1K30]
MHLLKQKVVAAALILSIATPYAASGQAGSTDDCTLVKPGASDGISKIEIHKSGGYCLTEDLHARIEFADHRAEFSLIAISASNVILDLQGHTLGRGRFFKNPGGFGILIDSRYSSIEIRNGTLQDFSVGIFRDSPRYPARADMPEIDEREGNYRFPGSKIELKNIKFMNNRKNFVIQVPQMDVPDTPRRDKSMYPPCGGTDYFGRPLIEGQPCNDAQ